jgi:putative salt-induced outer membrane protein YdiY
MNNSLGGLICGTLLVMASAARGDEIRLQNGDRLTGTLVSKTGGQLIFETAYAGRIVVDWAQVATLTTDEPVEIVLDDDTLMTGPLAPDTGGLVVTADGGEPAVHVELDQVAAIDSTEIPTLFGFKLSGRVAAGLSASRGNTDTDQIYLDGEAKARSLKTRMKLAADYRREDDSGQRTASNWNVTSNYDHFLTDQWYFFRNGILAHDRFQDLNLRIAGGAGFGYQFYESEGLNLSLEAGPNMVNEDFIDAPDRTYLGARWALAFDRIFYDGAFQFFHKHEGLLSLEDTDDILITSQSGVRVPLVHGIEATAQANVDWRNKPAPGNKSADTTVIMTIGYGW